MDKVKRNKIRRVSKKVLSQEEMSKLITKILNEMTWDEFKDVSIPRAG